MKTRYVRVEVSPDRKTRRWLRRRGIVPLAPLTLEDMLGWGTWKDAFYGAAYSRMRITDPLKNCRLVRL